MTKLNNMDDVKAIVVGKETCPTTGKIHYQTYVRFDNNKRFSWLHNQFPNAHIELRRGTEAEAAHYCRKEGQVLFDRGCAVERTSTSGGDTAENVMDMIEAGAPEWQIRQMHRRFLFFNGSRVDWYKNHVRTHPLPPNKRHKGPDSEEP